MSDVSQLPNTHSKMMILEVLLEDNVTNAKCIISAGSEKGDNYAGEIKRVKVVSKTDKRVLYNFILKYTLNKERFKTFDMDSVYDREGIMCKIIVPYLVKLQNEFNIPRTDMFKSVHCFKADSQMLLLQDMSVEGFRMHNRFNCYDSNHLELVMKTLAKYHSLSFVMKEYYPDKYQDYKTLLKEELFGNLDIFKNIGDQVLTVIDDSLKTRFQKFYRDAGEKYRQLTSSQIAEPYNVFSHGDCWNNNMLFKYENGVPIDMRLVDWQVSRYVSPLTDITYMLYCSTDSKMRSEYGKRIYDIYYDAFDKHLDYFKLRAENCYPRKIFDEHLEQFSIYGLLTGITMTAIALTEKGKEVDFSDMTEAKESRQSMHFGKLGTDRLNDLIRDFANMNMI